MGRVLDVERAPGLARCVRTGQGKYTVPSSRFANCVQRKDLKVVLMLHLITSS
jgi:hypothetical protein